jgi:UDP-N-acetylglucosamine--N-acetylmuramyl-(pentapeptide) pyrophosphoryl-undecaprenol N-acetylglucosamine transferase
MNKRILITAGGTGGHLYPAQGLAQQLVNHDILFVAGGLGTNRYFDRSVFPFKEVACHPLNQVKGWLSLLKGVWQSWKIIRHYQPDVVVGFGSYYTVATLLAAKFAKVPIVLHEANSIPGKANQWFAPYAKAIGVHFPSTISLLKGKVVEVEMPLRAGYERSCIAREAALRYFEMNETEPVLLIFGGSQGAKTLNQWIQRWLKKSANWIGQCIHLTGDESIVSALQSAYIENGIKACVKSFETHMQFAWRAADFFVGRAGASTIAEAIEFEVPGILVPYPYATDQHQDQNADFLVNTIGGAIKVNEPLEQANDLFEAIQQLTDSKNRAKKQEAIQAYKARSERLHLSQLVLNSISHH